jgi:hypothetical protein
MYATHRQLHFQLCFNDGRAGASFCLRAMDRFMELDAMLGTKMLNMQMPSPLK